MSDHHTEGLNDRHLTRRHLLSIIACTGRGLFALPLTVPWFLKSTAIPYAYIHTTREPTMTDHPIADDPYRGRLLFVAKEAVYKAVYPLDQTFLEHHDVEVSLADRRARVRNGRVVELRFGLASHIVALAFLPVGR